MKLSGMIKLGFGFYFGYEFAHQLDIFLGKVLKEIKDKKKKETKEVLKDDTCLRCGKGKASYCESCFQELIAKNAALQLQKDNKLIRLELVNEIEGEQ